MYYVVCCPNGPRVDTSDSSEETATDAPIQSVELFHCSCRNADEHYFVGPSAGIAAPFHPTTSHVRGARSSRRTLVQVRVSMLNYR